MKKRMKYLLLLSLLSFNLSILIQILPLGPVPLLSNWATIISVKTDPPINIQNNTALASFASSGNGSIGNPYILENYVINASGSGVDGIIIKNTDVYFILRNCTVTNAAPTLHGIWLDNVTHATITNNTILYNQWGIFLWESSYNTLSFNNASYNLGNGMQIRQNSDHNFILNNNLDHNAVGLEFHTGSDHNVVINNTGNYNIRGLESRYSCTNNSFLHNIANFNSWDGFYFYDSTYQNLSNNRACNNALNGMYFEENCDSNTILQNKILKNGIGLKFDNSDLNTIDSNTLLGNQQAIKEIYCSGNVFSNHIFTMIILSNADLETFSTQGNGSAYNPYIIEDFAIDAAGLGTDGINITNTDAYFILRNCNITNAQPTLHGIWLKNVTHATITNNNVHHNQWGIVLYQSSYNTLSYNNASYNLGNGIQVRYYSDHNTMINNTVNHNAVGLELYDSSRHNLVINNTGNYNIRGLEARWLCSNNTFSYNTANFNSREGSYSGDGFYFNLAGVNKISYNTALNNSDSGIFFDEYCPSNTLINNTLNHNYYGIFLNYFNNYNNLSRNTIVQNEIGIKIYNHCLNNTLINNSATQNMVGVMLDYHVEGQKIITNVFRNNIQYGIQLFSCDFNHISQNLLWENNGTGVYLDNSNNNTIDWNILLDNIEDIQEVNSFDNIITNNFYEYILNIINHSENGEFFIKNGVVTGPGIVEMNSVLDLNISLTYETLLGPRQTWSNVSFYFKINDDLWNGPYFLGTHIGETSLSFVIDEGNYSKYDELYYYFHFEQWDLNYGYFKNLYWSQDGLQLDESQARNYAFHKVVNTILHKLTLNYSVWYKAELERIFPSEAGYNVTFHPWMRIAYDNISLNFYNTTSECTNFSVSCMNESKLDHFIAEDTRNISKFVDPQFNLSTGIKSPFIWSLMENLTPQQSHFLFPLLLYDSNDINRNLTFTGELLNLTYRGLEQFPYQHRTVLNFTSASQNAIIRFDAFTGIMVYYYYFDEVVNASRKIMLGLIDNNRSYPINLWVEKRLETTDVGEIFLNDTIIQILYDPPGDHSYSQIQLGTTIRKGHSIETSSKVGTFAEAEFAGGSAGFGVNVDADWGESTLYDTESEWTFTRTLTSSTESENPDLIGPGRGDLYYLVGLIIQYEIKVERFYIVRNDPEAANEIGDDIQVWETGSRIDYGFAVNASKTVLAAYLDDYNASHLAEANPFADNFISTDENDRVDYIESQFWTPNTFTEISYYTANTTTKSSSITFDFSLEAYACWDVEVTSGLFIQVTTFQANGKLGVDYEYHSTTIDTSSTQQNKEIMVHLEDDDGSPIGEHDQFLVHLYHDKIYNTYGIIFDSNFTYTSRPYEFGTRDRRTPTVSQITNIDQYVHGVINLTCGAIDEETGVDAVQFYYDNDPFFDEDSILIGYQDIASTLDPNIYQLPWDTSLFHGTYYLFVKTYDSAEPVKNYLVSEAFLIQIDNIIPSTCQARAYGPFIGAINLFSLVFDADSGIAYVEYWNGNPTDPGSQLLGTSYDSSSSYNYIWATDPGGSDDGIHHIYARCYDRAGNLRDSTALTITIDSQAPSELDLTPLWVSILIGSLAIAGAILFYSYLRFFRPSPPPAPPKKPLITPKKPKS